MHINNYCAIQLHFSKHVLFYTKRNYAPPFLMHFWKYIVCNWPSALYLDLRIKSICKEKNVNTHNGKDQAPTYRPNVAMSCLAWNKENSLYTAVQNTFLLEFQIFVLIFLLIWWDNHHKYLMNFTVNTAGLQNLLNIKIQFIFPADSCPIVRPSNLRECERHCHCGGSLRQ